MQIGDCKHYEIDPGTASITIIVTADFSRRLMKYASNDHRTPGLLIIEAVEQMMSRYRKTKVDTLEKRVDQIMKELEEVLDESRRKDNSGDTRHVLEDDGK